MTMQARAPAATPSPRKFTVAEYYQMAEAGILHHTERVELIEGTVMLKSPPAEAPAPRRFTVAEYYRMAEAEILRPDERVELIEGEVVVMGPISSEHSGSVKDANLVFAQHIGKRFSMGIQDPVRLDDGSEPEPDISILKLREDNYRHAHPGPADILLIIEVAQSSLASDRHTKVPLYARAGVPETWLINLVEGCIEQFRQPGPAGYRQQSVLYRGEAISPAALPDLEFAVEDLLPTPAPASTTASVDTGEPGANED